MNADLNRRQRRTRRRFSGGATSCSASSPGDTLAEYAYLGLGRIVTEDYVQPQGKLNYDSGTPGEYGGFDRFGRVIEHLWYAYGASVDRDRYTYGYDRASNRLYRENTLTTGRDELYGYDGVNRLKTMDRGNLNNPKSAIENPKSAQDWWLDMTGNWPGYVQKTSGTTELDQGRTHNPVNEITEISASVGSVWIDPVHDRAGNMTTLPKPSSPADGLTCTWDAWNRLAEVKDGEIVVGRYHYDGLGRRVLRHLDSQSPADPSGIDACVHYYYNGAWQTLETRRSTSPGAEPETLQPQYQYIWSQRYIDACVLRDENTANDALCNEHRIYYLGDANFNVTTPIDTSGDPLERYVYSPYGVLTIYDATWSNIRSPSGYDVASTYTGRKFDPETELYYYRHRMYHGGLGRFLSRDPIGYKGMDANLYRYVGNNPLTKVDPSGTDWGQCILERAYCKNKSTSRSRLICYWRCRCPSDPPLQLDPDKPKYEPGVEEADEYLCYPCEGNLHDRDACHKEGAPLKRGDCSGRGGTKPSK